MNIIREISLRLKKENFYEDNILYMLDCDNKEDFEKISNLMYSLNRARFVKSYIELREYINSGTSKTICKNIFKIFKQFCTRDFNYKEVGNTTINMSYIGLILYCSLLDNEGNLNLGYKKVKNNLSVLIHNLLRQDLKGSALINIIYNFLGQYTNSRIELITLDNYLEFVQYAVTLYMLSIQHYTMLDDEQFLNNYLKMYISSLNLKNDTNGNYICFSSTVINIDEYVKEINRRVRLKGKDINRCGYLTKEASIGRCNTKVFKDLDGNVVFNKSLELVYNIKEIVSAKGIIIVYLIKIEEYFVLAIEDYTNNEVYLYQHFSGIAKVSADREEVQLIHVLAYTSVREHYITNLLINKKNLTDKVEVYSEPSRDYKSGDYVYKKIMIAPYKRKLPKGAHRTPDKEKDALKFNIILEEDETFVNSFIRDQRYVEDNSTDTNLANINEGVSILPKQSPEMNLNKTSIFSLSK